MTGMRPVPDFIAAVVTARDLVVTESHQHAWRVQPRESTLAWHCDLDDGTPTGDDDPASFVRWVCPALRWRGAAADAPLDVRRSGPQSDLGRLAARLGRLLSGAPAPDVQDRYDYTDPHGMIDAALRERLERGPTAMYGDLVERPYELTSIRMTHEGLVVSTGSWWGSAPALDHHIALAIDVAARLAARQAD